MDHWKPSNDFSSQPVIAATASPHDIVAPPPSNLLHGSIPEQPRQRSESEIKDTIAARKVQKADREKLRRDRLNEQFLELGSTLDPDRPKNDKATILTDAIQVLKDLTAEVRRLKAEYATLTEESRELTQEKNELREEKTSLKSDIESLNAQYQQRLRVAYPWASVDPAVVMGPPFSYPVPVPVPSGPIPMHPSLQPFPFFGSQNGGAISGPCSTFIPYPTPVNPPNEQPLAQQASASHVSSKQDSKSKSHHQTGNNRERCDDSDDVATDLELKTPGSSSKQESPNEARKGKQVHRKENKFSNVSSSSSYSSPQGNQESSSNSVTDIPKSNS